MSNFLSDRMDVIEERLDKWEPVIEDLIGSDEPPPLKTREFRGGILTNEDYSWVRWGHGAEPFVFSPKQKEVVRVLMYAYDGPGVPVSQEKLLTAAKSKPTSTVPKLFKRGRTGKHPAWGTMIRSDRRGKYWIVAPKES